MRDQSYFEKGPFDPLNQLMYLTSTCIVRWHYSRLVARVENMAIDGEVKNGEGSSA